MMVDLNSLMGDAIDLVTADASGGTACTYTCKGQSGVVLRVIFGGQPETLSLGDRGRDSVREVRVVVPPAALALLPALPKRDDTLLVASGDYVGNWIVDRLEERDVAGSTVVARQDKQQRVAGAGVLRPAGG